MRLKNTARQYRYFIFLNSSVRGPFYPSYMPPGWQWTQAYTSRLTSQIKVPQSLSPKGRLCAVVRITTGPSTMCWGRRPIPCASTARSYTAIFEQQALAEARCLSKINLH